MTVLRNGTPGRRVPDRRAAARSSWSRKMIGKELDDAGGARGAAASAPSPRWSAARRSLRGRRARAATARSRRSTSTIHQGEVVGLAGLLGSGRTELARLLFGADHADSGQVAVDGEPVTLRSPRAAMAHGIAFCSENRTHRGAGRRADRPREHHPRAAGRARLDPPDPAPAPGRAGRASTSRRSTSARPTRSSSVGNLSGGNQQKVLLARWLITEPRLLILDEPTRGIDVGAKAEIQRLVVELSDGGHGGAVHLRRAGGGAAAQPQGRRAARPPAGRRAAPTTTALDDRPARRRRSRAEPRA